MELFNQFMHIYFWVYLTVVILNLVVNYEKKESKYRKGVGFLEITGFVIFIMSFKY